MNILDKIISHKKTEIQEAKETIPVKVLERTMFFEGQSVSMKKYLNRKDKIGIIAEIKRKSPSKGVLAEDVDIEKLSISYMQSGASALSILTDQQFFGGNLSDLETARKFNYCPILRKDFIIDEYQVIQSKSVGADCILLIAACLDPKQTNELARLAKSIGLEVLLEIRTEEEIAGHLNEFIDIVGVNNRDLKSFNTDIKQSIELAEKLPKTICKISESGIVNADSLLQLKESGYQGFLIGGHFMAKSDPANACKNLINHYKTLTHEN